MVPASIHSIEIAFNPKLTMTQVSHQRKQEMTLRVMVFQVHKAPTYATPPKSFHLLAVVSLENDKDSENLVNPVMRVTN